MIHVTCDPGSRYTKFAAARSERFEPHFAQFPSHQADDLAGLAKQVAQRLRPGLFEPVTLWIVGDGWVPRRARSKPVLMASALAQAVAGLGDGVLVADCGGLRTRVFETAGGLLKRTHENERCTSGGGRFVETMSAALGIGLDQVDACVAAAKAPCRVSSPCMVFAESEMISQVNAGVAREDVLAGVVAHAVEKVATLVGVAQPAGRPLVVTGGLGRLAAFCGGLSARLPGVEILVPPGDPLFFNCHASLAMVCEVPAQRWVPASTWERSRHAV